MAYTPGPTTVSDVYRITYFAQMFDQTIETVLHAHITSGSGGAYDAAITAMLTQLVSDLSAVTNMGEIVGLQTNAINYTSIRVQRIYPVREVYGENIVNVSGTLSSAPVPQNLCLSVTKHTLQPGRKGVGRMQLAGLPAGETSGGVWNPGYLTTVATNVAWLHQDLNIAGPPLTMRWCLYGPTLPGLRWTDIVRETPERQVRTMHRRTVGLGI